MNILVLNSGSSSLKYQLIDMRGETVLASGQVERIGMDEPTVRHGRLPGTPEELCVERGAKAKDHAQALRLAVDLLTAPAAGVIQDADAIGAIGHRVVHGGERFREPARIDKDVIEGIRANIPLAPLHNPSGLLGIETALALFPGVPQVAVFDTAFHQTIPPKAFHYAIPYALYEELGIRRYGFHGTSHGYVAREAAKMLGKPLSQCNLITLHIGNGASITAIENGKSVDTSMGMTPLGGVIMGTRSGDIDPAIVTYLEDRKKMSVREIDAMLTKESGLKGICGASDMRDVHALIAKGEKKARLALDMTVYKYKMFIGAYYAVLGRVDALVFTAGIGENDPIVRHDVCWGLEKLGIVLDPDKNNTTHSGGAREIGAASGSVSVFVIPTDEELEIARQTATIINRE
jgi:acetate kinase